MTIRVRMIRPGFWEDEDMAELTPAVRLTFMGLWGLSDDDGYFEWKSRAIAAALYRYAPPGRRERDVEAHLSTLLTARRIRHLECGVHGVVPSMPEHRIQSGRHTFAIRRDHESCRGIPRPAASRSESSMDSDVVGSVRDRTGVRAFSEAMAAEADRLGLPSVAAMADRKRRRVGFGAPEDES